MLSRGGNDSPLPVDLGSFPCQSRSFPRHSRSFPCNPLPVPLQPASPTIPLSVPEIAIGEIRAPMSNPYPETYGTIRRLVWEWREKERDWQGNGMGLHEKAFRLAWDW